jgi:optic atrophy 3 protein
MPIVVKLFFLAVRQASKPMANGLKRAAQSSDVFTAVLAATGRTLHRVTLQITRASEGKDQLATVAKLAEKAAIQRGADLLSEAFIYSVAGATVYYEWSMQQREKVQKAAKDAANEAQRREDMRKNEERQWDEVRRRSSYNTRIYVRARHTHTHTHASVHVAHPTATNIRNGCHVAPARAPNHCERCVNPHGFLTLFDDL